MDAHGRLTPTQFPGEGTASSTTVAPLDTLRARTESTSSRTTTTSIYTDARGGGRPSLDSQATITRSELGESDIYDDAHSHLDLRSTSSLGGRSTTPHVLDHAVHSSVNPAPILEEPVASLGQIETVPAPAPLSNPVEPTAVALSQVIAAPTLMTTMATTDAALQNSPKQSASLTSHNSKGNSSSAQSQGTEKGINEKGDVVLDELDNPDLAHLSPEQRKILLDQVCVLPPAVLTVNTG